MVGVFGMEGDGLPKSFRRSVTRPDQTTERLYSLLNKSFIVLEVSISSHNYLRQPCYMSHSSYFDCVEEGDDA